MTRAEDVARYSAAVRSALTDLPRPAREDLLTDLEDHLAEVAAEPGPGLWERLGSPDDYAAELRAAYGARLPSTTRQKLRSRPFILLGVLLAGLGVAAWLLVTNMSGSHDLWPYARLTAEARAGHVRAVDIRGNQAVVTASDGSQHSVNVPDDAATLGAELQHDGVNVQYQTRASGLYWLLVLVPNVALVVLIGGTVTLLVYLSRRSVSRRWPALGRG